MKIEMGESLIYSWLRHEKQCQLVQVNWKPSPYWGLDNYDRLKILIEEFDLYFKDRCGYDIFRNCSLEQLLKQAEIDAVGIAFNESSKSIIAVDIAYHGAGLNYGDKDKTLSKIIQKYVRTALCLYGYFNIAIGEIIFASPKINPSIEEELNSLFKDLTHLIKNLGLEFTVLLYCNDAFFSGIMEPVLTKGVKIADTSELFLRSTQLYQMFVHPHLKATTHLHPNKKDGPQLASQKVDKYDNGKAIARIPKWATSPDQCNYKIIRAYFQILNESGRVDRPTLEARCQNEHEHLDVYVKDFKGNFASMKTDKGNSHGKVFTDDGYNIKIWDEVIGTLENCRDQFMA